MSTLSGKESSPFYRGHPPIHQHTCTCGKTNSEILFADEFTCMECFKRQRPNKGIPETLLLNLVRIKLYKERVGKDDYYRREQLHAWKQALDYFEKEFRTEFDRMKKEIDAYEGNTTGLSR